MSERSLFLEGRFWLPAGLVATAGAVAVLLARRVAAGGGESAPYGGVLVQPAFLGFVWLCAGVLVCLLAILGHATSKRPWLAALGGGVGALPELAYPSLYHLGLMPSWGSATFYRLRAFVDLLEMPGGWAASVFLGGRVGHWTEGLVNPPPAAILVEVVAVMAFNGAAYSGVFLVLAAARTRAKRSRGSRTAGAAQQAAATDRGLG